jgi:hypothetical protein
MTLDPSIPMQGMNRPRSSLADMVSLADNIGQMQYNQQMRPMQMQEQQGRLAAQQTAAMTAQQEAEQKKAEREQAKQYRQNFDQVTKAYVQETGKYDPMEIMNRLAQADPQTAQFYQEKMTKYGEFLGKYQKDMGEYEKVILENKAKGMQVVGKMLDGVSSQQEYDGVLDAVLEFGLDDELSLDPRFDPHRARAIVNTVINDLDRRKVAIDEMNARAQIMNAQTQREKLSMMEERGDKPKPKDIDQAQRLYNNAKIKRRTILRAIDELVKDVEINPESGEIATGKPAGATGANPVRVAGVLPFGNQKKFENRIKQLKGHLTLNERSQMRGQGVITKAENEMIEKAATLLSTDLGPEDFMNELSVLRQTILGMESDDDSRFDQTYGKWIAPGRVPGELVEDEKEEDFDSWFEKVSQ